MYVNGFILQRPTEIPLDIFIEELKFYRLPKSVLVEYLKTEGIEIHTPPDISHRLRYKIWYFLEVPKVNLVLSNITQVDQSVSFQSSHGAQCLHYFNTILILISVFMFCIETHPVFREGCQEGQSCKGASEYADDIT